tara:strand:+ start:229 stop:387 length:159 start_codon:yes stop_codon:yes gene_type:complete
VGQGLDLRIIGLLVEEEVLLDRLMQQKQVLVGVLLQQLLLMLVQVLVGTVIQ